MTSFWERRTLRSRRQSLLAGHDDDVPLIGLTAQRVERNLFAEAKLFAHIDADGDGSISADEFVAAFMNAARHPTFMFSLSPNWRDDAEMSNEAPISVPASPKSKGRRRSLYEGDAHYALFLRMLLEVEEGLHAQNDMDDADHDDTMRLIPGSGWERRPCVWVEKRNATQSDDSDVPDHADAYGIALGSCLKWTRVLVDAPPRRSSLLSRKAPQTHGIKSPTESAGTEGVVNRADSLDKSGNDKNAPEKVPRWVSQGESVCTKPSTFVPGGWAGIGAAADRATQDRLMNVACTAHERARTMVASGKDGTTAAISVANAATAAAAAAALTTGATRSQRDLELAHADLLAKVVTVHQDEGDDQSVANGESISESKVNGDGPSLIGERVRVGMEGMSLEEYMPGVIDDFDATDGYHVTYDNGDAGWESDLSAVKFDSSTEKHGPTEQQHASSNKPAQEKHLWEFLFDRLAVHQRFGSSLPGIVERMAKGREAAALRAAEDAKKLEAAQAHETRERESAASRRSEAGQTKLEAAERCQRATKVIAQRTSIGQSQLEGARSPTPSTAALGPTRLVAATATAFNDTSHQSAHGSPSVPSHMETKNPATSSVQADGRIDKFRKRLPALLAALQRGGREAAMAKRIMQTWPVQARTVLLAEAREKQQQRRLQFTGNQGHDVGLGRGANRGRWHGPKRGSTRRRGRGGESGPGSGRGSGRSVVELGPFATSRAAPAPTPPQSSLGVVAQRRTQYEQPIWQLRSQLRQLKSQVMLGTASADVESECQRVEALCQVHPHSKLSDEEARAMLTDSNSMDSDDDGDGETGGSPNDLGLVAAMQAQPRPQPQQRRLRQCGQRRGSVSGNVHVLQDQLRQESVREGGSSGVDSGDDDDSAEKYTIVELRLELRELRRRLVSGTCSLWFLFVCSF
eukprot:g2810.t1